MALRQAYSLAFGRHRHHQEIKKILRLFPLPLQVGSFSLHRYVSSFHSTEEETVPIGQYLPCSHRSAGKTPVPN